MRTLLVLSLLSVFGFTFAVGCSCTEQSDPVNDGGEDVSLAGPEAAAASCDFPISDDPGAADVCATGVIVFGPEILTRTAGKPSAWSGEFDLAESSVVCIQVRNGEDRTSRLSSAELSIDGTAVVLPQQLNPHVEGIDARMPLGAGRHDIAVELRSRPNARIELLVRAAVVPSLPNVGSIGEAGLLEVSNVVGTPSIFTPDNDGVTDSAVLTGTIKALMLPGSQSSEQQFIVDYRFEVIAPTSCVTLRTLVGSTTIQPAISAQVSVEWQGLSDDGTRVADGRYLFRLHASLRKVHRGNSTRLDQASSGAWVIALDTVGPRIALESPRIFGDSTAMLWDPAQGLGLRIDGTTFDPAGVVSVEASLNGIPVDLVLDGPTFSGDTSLDGGGFKDLVDNKLEIVAIDGVGHSSQVTLPILVAQEHKAGRLLVRFHSGPTQSVIHDIIEDIQADILHVTPELRLFVLQLDPATSDAALVANELNEKSEVLYATQLGVTIPDSPGLCDPALERDPLLYTPYQWDLENFEKYAVLDYREDLSGSEVLRPCGLDFDCFAGDQCLPNVCVWGTPTEPGEVGVVPGAGCTSDAHCPAGSFCAYAARCRPSWGVGKPGTLSSSTCDSSQPNADQLCAITLGVEIADCVEATGYCGRRGEDGADLGWVAAQDDVCAAREGAPIVVAIGETTELCESGPLLGSKLCAMPNADHTQLRGQLWTNSLECCGEATCPVDGSGRSICSVGEAIPDGAPGRAGFDDDGDGKQDFEDEEVLNLIARLCCNGLDDDGASRT